MKDQWSPKVGWVQERCIGRAQIFRAVKPLYDTVLVNV